MLIRRNAVARAGDFTWTKSVGVAEASDIGLRDFVRLYDDAADVGLWIQNRNSGASVAFYLSEERRDADGDVQVWILRPVAEHVRHGLCRPDAEIHVLND